MAIGSEEFGAVLHRLGGDPDVVGGDRSPLTPQLQGDPGIPVGRHVGDGYHFDRFVFEESGQQGHVVVETRTVAETEQDLPEDHRRDQDRFGAGDLPDGRSVLRPVKRVHIRVDEDFHFHIFSSISSKILIASSNSLASSSVHPPANSARDAPLGGLFLPPPVPVPAWISSRTTLFSDFPDSLAFRRKAFSISGSAIRIVIWAMTHL